MINMSDTKVTGGTPERAAQLAEEVIAMMESLKAIKGETYCEAITSIFTLHNLVGILVIDNTRMQAMAEVSPDEVTIMNIPAAEFIDLVVGTITSITTLLATNFAEPFKGKEEYAARHMAKSKEMMQDIRMLLKKQDEYNGFGKE
jgi:hypothetical protein